MMPMIAMTLRSKWKAISVATCVSRVWVAIEFCATRVL
jgi:hypothetical protein